MAVTIYRSTDGGAPSYLNTAGSLLAVLDYCLVTGQSWTKTVFSTNLASYTQPNGTQGRILQVDDTNAAYAKCTGWETLTAASTGTAQFPLPAASVPFYYVNHASSGVAVPWRLITNGSLFHFFVNWNTGAGNWDMFTFGDFISYYTGDVHNTVIGGSGTNGSAVMGWNNNNGISNSFNGTATSMAINRAYNQVSVSPSCTFFVDFARMTNTTLGAGSIAYPDPISGKLNMTPIWIGEAAYSYGTKRGLLPGLFAPLHNHPFNDGDTFNVAAGLLSGRTFEVVAGSANGQIIIETSNTWGGF